MGKSMRGLRIQCIPVKQMDDLENIKKYTGKTMSAFVKDKIPSIIETYYNEFPNNRPQKKDVD
jgi:hypothetical protein